MKEINISIRIDDKTNKLIFITSRTKDEDTEVSEILKVIGVLDILKNREMQRLERLKSMRFN